MEKTGIELIADERLEQITKHGITTVMDRNFNPQGQLSYVAGLLANEQAPQVENIAQYCPPNWNVSQFLKMVNKPYPQRLKIAGALIAAELDRINK